MWFGGAGAVNPVQTCGMTSGTPGLQSYDAVVDHEYQRRLERGTMDFRAGRAPDGSRDASTIVGECVIALG